ncbi:MAG: hypothetical protein ACP5IM_07730 [Candidatus Bathyarchaeia archaeon]
MGLSFLSNLIQEEPEIASQIEWVHTIGAFSLVLFVAGIGLMFAGFTSYLKPRLSRRGYRAIGL